MRDSRPLRALVWLVIAALALPVFAGQSPTPGWAQEPAVRENVLMDTFVDVPAGEGVLTLSRITLAGADRTESLLLETPVSIAIETGSMKLWTRAGTVVDGVPLVERTNTVFVDKGQTVNVPAGIRFRIRAAGCFETKLLFVALAGCGGDLC